MKRTVALGALWAASAAAAVGLGFLAVSLVDASASPGTTGTAPTLLTPEVTPGATPGPTPSGSPTAEHATEAGTVFANCAGGVPVLAGAPAAGWWIDDSDDPGQVEFENGTQKLEVHVVCGPGGPEFTVEGPRGDDGGDDGSGDDGVPAVTPSPATPSADDHGGADDSSGRDGGGHGSDDSGSDDSGSDDSGSDDSGSDDSGGGHGSDELVVAPVKYSVVS